MCLNVSGNWAPELSQVVSQFEQSRLSMCLRVSGNWAPELSHVVSQFEQSRPSMCLEVSGNWVLEISQVVSYEIKPGSLLRGSLVVSMSIFTRSSLSFP